MEKYWPIIALVLLAFALNTVYKLTRLKKSLTRSSTATPKDVKSLVWYIISRLINKALSPEGSGFSLKKYHYQKKDFFLTKAEHEFYGLIKQLFGFKYAIFAQVHLPTILNHTIKGQSWKGAFAHVNGKSVDFVLCDKTYLKPLLAIEVDDASHQLEERQLRDEEVERILAEAEMPLIRIVNHGSFEREAVYRKIAKALGQTPAR